MNAECMTSLQDASVNGSLFLADALRARELWCDRSSWQRDDTGECRADRVWRGLLCSAAHAEIRGDKWSRLDQLELEAAGVEYEHRLRLSLAMSNNLAKQ